MKKQFKCKPCNKTFPKQSQLTRHLNTIFHSGGLQVPCPHCPGKYSRKDIMLAHMRVKHPELINSEGGQLTPSNKKSSKVTKVTMTKKAPVTSVKEKDKPFICTVCSQRFRLQNTLTCHMRRHTGERPYHCPHCTWTFTQSTPLKMHMLKIHGVEGYQVAKPGRRLPKPKTSAPVVKRKDNPTSVTPVMALRKRKGFQCQVCGLRVQNEIQLNEHLNSHKLKEEEEEPLEDVWGVQVPLRDPLEVSMGEDQFEIEFASEYIDEEEEEETEAKFGEIRGQFVSLPGQFEEPEVIQLDSDDEDEEEEEIGIKIERVSSCSSSFEGMPEGPPEILEIFDEEEEEEEMKPVIIKKNEIRCTECGRTFGNHGALGVHRKKIHGRRSSSGGYLSVSR